MAGEWRTVSFQQLIDEGLLEIGDGYRAQNHELGGTGPIFLRAGHVTDTHIDFTGVDHFHNDLSDKLRPKMSQVGDTIITTKGNSTGRTSFVTARLPPFVYSPHLSYWRTHDAKKLCGGFLRYWSQGIEFVNQLSGMKASTDMAPYLSLTDQRRLTITLPTVAEQRAIAAILGSLDDKIELNRRMNATLEAMARALFQSWFVDFDPVRAKTSELIAQKVLEIGDGYRAKNSELHAEGLPFVRAGDLDSGFDLDRAERLSFTSVTRASTKLSRPGDVAFTSKGTVGRIARVDATLPQFVYAPQVCFWRSTAHDKIHPAILYCWMMSEDFKSQLMSRAGQTDMAPYVSLTDQRDLLVPRFPKSQAEVGNSIQLYLDQNAANRNQSRTLAALRDTLLPKLLSGELRIKDAERFVGQVI